MGSFFIDLLSFDHDVAVIERDPKRMRFTYNCQRFTSMDEVKAFAPELVINAVTVKYTIPAFEQIMPYLPKDCIISDISSVKTSLKAFYEQTGHPYVSTHPMFDPPLPISTSYPKKTPSSSAKATTWDASSSKIYISGSDCTSTNTRLRSTTKPWPTR